MAARIIDGKSVADARRATLTERVAALATRGIHPCLAAISVHQDPAWGVYLRNQAAACLAVGIRHRTVALAADCTQEELSVAIETLNADDDVHGIILQSPLRRGDGTGPDLSDIQAQNLLSPSKDVEGVSPTNLGLVLAGRPALAPCTALAAVELCKAAMGDVRGVDAVVVGASTIVGKPIAQLLMALGATVTVCHIDTRDLKRHTQHADLIIVAVGKAGLIRPEHIKPGAVVIDVGINRVTGIDGKTRTVGDVDPTVTDVAGALSPVPGGVGALTTTILLESTTNAAERLANPQVGMEGAVLAQILGVEPSVAKRLAQVMGRHLAPAIDDGSRVPLDVRIARGVLVLDGAMGSELIAQGVAPERIAHACLERPDLVMAVHQSYLDAGAEALTTNTFGANRSRLAGDSALTLKIIKAGVQLARQVAQGRAYVIGSISPLGKMIGTDISSTDADEIFAEAALALANAGADALLIETMTSTAEAAIALAAARRVTKVPVLVSRTVTHDDAAELAEFSRVCSAGGATAIGVNCSAGPRMLSVIATHLAALTTLPVLVRPNAGNPVRENGKPVYHLRPDYLISHMAACVNAGVGILGGCCGIGPVHIAALAKAFAGAPLPARITTTTDIRATEPSAVIGTGHTLLDDARHGRFPVIAMVPGRLAPTIAAAAVKRLADAGAHAVGLLAGWPGATRGTRLPARLAHVQASAGRAAVLDVVATDTTLIHAQEMLLTAHLLGIHTVIIDAGVFSAESRADATRGCDAIELVELIKQLNQGLDLSGSRLEEPTAFVVGVRLPTSLIDQRPADVPAFVTAGARFFTLQPIYEAAHFRAAMSALTNVPLPIFAEILVLPDAATAEEIDNEIPRLSIPEHLRKRLAIDPTNDARGVERFLHHWRGRLAGAVLMLPDDRTTQAEAIVRSLCQQVVVTKPKTTSRRRKTTVQR